MKKLVWNSKPNLARKTLIKRWLKMIRRERKSKLSCKQLLIKKRKRKKTRHLKTQIHLESKISKFKKLIKL